MPTTEAGLPVGGGYDGRMSVCHGNRQSGVQHTFPIRYIVSNVSDRSCRQLQRVDKTFQGCQLVVLAKVYMQDAQFSQAGLDRQRAAT